MKRIAIAELEGVALDWAVAKAARVKPEICQHYPGPPFVAVVSYPEGFKPDYFRGAGNGGPFRPTTDWSQVGPLIERYKVDLSYHEEYVANDGKGPVWEAMLADLWLAPADEYDPIGKTPLIAACRAIVAAHNPSGFVEVPDELVEGE